MHGGDRRHRSAEAGQDLGIEELDAIHRQHRVECRGIVRHAAAVAAGVVGKRHIIAGRHARLDRAIGVGVQILRRLMGTFTGHRHIGEHVPVGIGKDDRGQRSQHHIERKRHHADRHGKTGIDPAAGRQRRIGQPVDRHRLRWRPGQHRCPHPTWLFTKSLTIDTMPRPSRLSSASTNWSTCCRSQISGGSRRMTLRLYSVKATSTS